jgi:membrane-bound metal-dependent hydrolase YbcI (DUF457 family)
MDPITHIAFTRTFIGKDRRVTLAGIASDAPFYLIYPAWVMRQGSLKQAVQNNEWPDPPVWLESCHQAFHSLPVLLLAALLARWGQNGRFPRKLFIAWFCHILIDIPTHSRRRWGVQFLWPFSRYAVDGISWAELALFFAHRLRHKSRPAPESAPN